MKNVYKSVKICYTVGGGDYMSIFAQRLKETIITKGVSQKWLADKSNTTEATISRYIKEVNSPAVLVILTDIAKALNVSSDYLLGITNIPTTKASITTEEKILLKCFSNMTDSDRYVLWALLDKYMTAQEKQSLEASTDPQAVDVV